MSQIKVDLVNQGRSPIVETEVAGILRRTVDAGRLRACSDAAKAVSETELSMVCVGTPSNGNGSLDMRHVRNVCAEIGAALAKLNRYHVVVIRSTILPGTMRKQIIPALERASGKRAGVDFGICNNPEFLREGTAVRDYYDPPKTVIGCSDERSGKLVLGLYDGVPGPKILVDIDTAETVKYVDNVWHALKVGFANEIGNICKALGVDSHKVMGIFVQDTKLNIASTYLKPGFAFGGSCLPKDLRALNYCAKILDVDSPILQAILPSNQLHIERALQMIMRAEGKKVGVLGFSFKAGTDDLRESPIVEIIERLLGKGYDVRIYDRNVNVARLGGANRDFILNHIPHICALMSDSLADVIAHADTVVVGNGAAEFMNVPSQLGEKQKLIDLVRVSDPNNLGSRYEGICW